MGTISGSNGYVIEGSFRGIYLWRTGADWDSSVCICSELYQADQSEFQLKKLSPPKSNQQCTEDETMVPLGFSFLQKTNPLNLTPDEP